MITSLETYLMGINWRMKHICVISTARGNKTVATIHFFELISFL